MSTGSYTVKYTIDGQEKEMLVTAGTPDGAIGDCMDTLNQEYPHTAYSVELPDYSTVHVSADGALEEPVQGVWVEFPYHRKRS